MKKKKIAIGLSIIVIAIAAVGVGLYFYFGSAKNLFTRALTKSINELVDSSKSSIFNNLNYDTMKVTTKTNGTIAVDKDNYSFAINGDVGYDRVSKKVNSELSVLGNNQVIADVQAVFDSTKIYFKLKDLMKDFYYMDIDVDASNTIEQEDVNYLRELVQKKFFAELKDSDFTKSKEKVELDKSFSTTKLTLKLTDKRTTEIVEAILKTIKDDKKAISIIQKIDKNFKETDIDAAIKSIKNEKISDKDYLLYSIYITSGNNIVKHEISAKLEGNEEVNNYKVVINSYTNKNGYKNNDFIVIENNGSKELVNISVKGTSKEESTITITSEMVTASGTLTKKSNEESLTLKLNVSGMDVGTITYALIKNSNTDYDYNMKIDAGVLTYKFNLESTNKLLLNEKITNIDITNSKNINTMTEQEQTNIMTAIYTRLAKAFPSLMQ